MLIYLLTELVHISVLLDPRIECKTSRELNEFLLILLSTRSCDKNNKNMETSLDESLVTIP